VGFAIGILVVVLVGLFTNVGAGPSGAHQPNAGDPVPAFRAPNVGRSGPSVVSVSATGGRPTVILFFARWCPACHTELPPLAAAVTEQAERGGTLSSVRVVGVDSLESSSSAQAFIRSSGVTFPVGFDPAAAVLQGTFQFRSDPYAVFVRPDGTIAQVVPGAQLTPAQFSADEQALIPSGT
jgi:peroxiredoxin